MQISKCGAQRCCIFAMDEPKVNEGLSMKSVVCRSSDIVTSEIDDSIVMMSVSAGTFYGLNAVGSAIWQFVERPTTVATIITHISAEFEVSEAQCQDDILTFIEAMLDKKTLIRAV